MTSATENVYFLSPPALRIRSDNEGLWLVPDSLLPDAMECDSWKDILERTSVLCFEMTKASPERLSICPKLHHKWVAGHQDRPSRGTFFCLLLNSALLSAPSSAWCTAGIPDLCVQWLQPEVFSVAPGLFMFNNGFASYLPKESEVIFQIMPPHRYN